MKNGCLERSLLKKKDYLASIDERNSRFDGIIVEDFGSFLPDSDWEFVREILNLTLQVLKPEGKFYAQVRTPPHAENCVW